MRRPIKQKLANLATFVEIGNLGRDEIKLRGEFPKIAELQPLGAHRQLLRLLNRRVSRCAPSIKFPAAPPLYLPMGGLTLDAITSRRVHAFFLVRRIMDLLIFLTHPNHMPRTKKSKLPFIGVNASAVLISMERLPGGDLTLTPDAFEDFLRALRDASEKRLLARMRSCSSCGKFFLAGRTDQKGCSTRCANVLRVRKVRQKSREYQNARKFRKRAGLRAMTREERAKVKNLASAIRDEG